jgi:hypothetical protein
MVEGKISKAGSSYKKVIYKEYEISGIINTKKLKRESGTR